MVKDNEPNLLKTKDAGFRIRELDEGDIDSVVTFVSEFRRALYPMLDPTKIPADLAAFKQYYLEMPFSGGYLAEDREGRLIGFIAMRSYDHRFRDKFIVENEPAVEVQKLFVAPELRRQGIASVLFQNLLNLALQKGIGTLYLHTHPFLPGAETFWEKHGFHVIQRDTEPVFRTIHMIRPVESDRIL